MPTRNTAAARGRYLGAGCWRSSGGSHLWITLDCLRLLERPRANSGGSRPGADPRRLTLPQQQRRAFLRINCACLVFSTWLDCTTFPCAHIFNAASRKFRRFNVNLWFLWLRSACGVCSDISYLRRGTVFYGKRSSGVMLADVTECSFNRKQTNIVTVVQS